MNARDVILEALEALGSEITGPDARGACYIGNPTAELVGASTQHVQHATIITDLDDNGNILGFEILWGKQDERPPDPTLIEILWGTNE